MTSKNEMAISYYTVTPTQGLEGPFMEFFRDKESKKVRLEELKGLPHVKYVKEVQ